MIDSFALAEYFANAALGEHMALQDTFIPRQPRDIWTTALTRIAQE